MIKKGLFLLVALTSSHHGLASTPAESQLPFSGIKIDAKNQAMLAKAYCKDLDAENRFIDELNALAAGNVRKLKVGSQADYDLTHIRLDKQGKEIEQVRFTETWKVSELKGELATVEIRSDRADTRYESIKLFPFIYSQKPSLKEPITCLYWRAFAESKKKLEYKIGNETIPAYYRAQTVFSNVLPEFTYGQGIPFHILESKETSEYSESRVIKTRKLKSYHF
jgi:hypothetical protein